MTRETQPEEGEWRANGFTKGSTEALPAPLGDQSPLELLNLPSSNLTEPPNQRRLFALLLQSHDCPFPS